MCRIECFTLKVAIYTLSGKTLKFVDQFKNNISSCERGCPRGVLVKAMDCGIVVREFVLQSRYYVHFRANTLGNGMNPLISLQLWVNSRAD